MSAPSLPPWLDDTAKRSRRPKSLLLKLLVLVVSFAVLAEIGSAAVIAHFGMLSAHQGFDKRVSAFVDARKQIIGTLVWRLRFEELDGILREMLSEDSIVSVRVYDEANTLVGSAKRQDDSGGEIVTRAADLLYSNDNVQDKAGRIEVRATLAPILAENRRQLLYAFAVALASAIAISFAIWAAVTGLVARPLAVLRKTIALSRRGAKGVRAPDRPLDEIGILYQAFNRLMENNDRQVLDIQEANERLRRLAERDDLTGLPNRRVAQAAFAAHRGERNVAVHFLDLDKFKLVNDTLGHRAGDALLRQFAARLVLVLDGRATAYRLGGDEFLVLQTGVKDQDDATSLAEAIRQDTSNEYELGTVRHRLGVSIGVYVAEEGLDDFDDILGLADLALAEAKQSGRGRAAILAPEMRQALVEKVWLEREIRQAISSAGFEAHFQPQIDAETGKIVSAESLSRWSHPERGMIPPSKFMPLIEEMGLSLEHGRLMIAHCCAAAATLRARTGSDLRISLNANAQQVGHPAFWATLTHELARHRLSPSAIEIEVTESELMENFEAANRALAAYRSLGGAIALDDFGTGYSSLAYLTKLPFDTIKIDRTFVCEATENAIGAAIIRLVVGFTRETGTSVIAEGIETEEQERMVLACGVKILQGYRYGRPQPLGELLDQIRRGQTSEAPGEHLPRQAFA